MRDPENVPTQLEIVESMPKKEENRGRRYSVEFKREAASALANRKEGVTVEQVADEYGVTSASIHLWRRQLENGELGDMPAKKKTATKKKPGPAPGTKPAPKPAPAPSEDVIAMRAELISLRTENERLRKALDALLRA